MRVKRLIGHYFSNLKIFLDESKNSFLTNDNNLNNKIN